MEELNYIQRISIGLLPILFAITVHEAAHGWAAQRLGDPTAKMLGRVTLNPIKHIDLVGTLLVPSVMLLVGGLLFGWAKPVPVTWENLRHPRRDMALVALAGPLANLAMALLWAALLKVGVELGMNSGIGQPLAYMALMGIGINIMLMVLNLLPLPPLDGSRVVSGMLPDVWALKYNRIEPYGIFILLGLAFSGLLWGVMAPMVNGFESVIFTLLNL